MRGDFSRVPFDPGANITRVLFQQGRPLVEADMNEALEALLNCQRELVRKQEGYDKHFGPFGTNKETAFRISRDGENKLQVDGGQYRFEGIVAKNESGATAKSYRQHGAGYIVDFERGEHNPPRSAHFVVGLAVTERPLLLREITARAPATGKLRSAIPWGVFWVVFLEPYTPGDDAGTEAEKKRQEILDRNHFTPKSPDVLGLQVEQSEQLPQQLLDCLWRLEVHSTDGEKAQLKLAVDNASFVFKANKVETGKVLIEQYSGLQLQRNSYVEVESNLSWFNGPGDLYQLNILSEYRDGLLGSSTSIAGEIVDDSAQLRLWNWSDTVSIADLLSPNGIAVGKSGLTVRFNAVNSDAKNAIREGDGWSFRTGQLAKNGSIADADAIAGSRRKVYYQALGTAHFDDNGDVRVEHDTFRAAVSDNGLTEESAVQHAQTQSRLTLDQIPLIDQTLCHRLFPQVATIATRRWLASATLKEITGLSKEQLRATIYRDCSSHEIDGVALEKDLNLIISKRRQFLPTLPV